LIARPVLDRLRRARRRLRFLWALRVLPPRIALFQWRAMRLARRIGDDFSVVSATRPDKLRVLLRAAAGRRHVVELGTGTAWTSISLLLADPARELVSYDPVERTERELYLRLASRSVRDRLRLVKSSGAAGPQGRQTVDLLYIDSSHEREDTIREVEVWRPALSPGAVIVFDDFDHPVYPGVREAVAQLRLAGEQRGSMFVATPA
jgi:predicted O-methyltransferase YrrM